MRNRFWASSFIWLLLIFACNNHTNKKQSILEKDSSTRHSNEFDTISYDYKEASVLKILEDVGARSINDTAKWYLYNIYCDYPLPGSLKDTITNIYLSFLELKPLLCQFSIDSTSIQLFYSFIYKNKQVQNFPEAAGIARGINIELKSRRILNYISNNGGTMTISKNNAENDIVKPHLNFVTKYSNSLNAWYKIALFNHGINL